MLNPFGTAGCLYDFGGLRVLSAFDLPGLAAISEESLHGRAADIHISINPAPLPTGRHIHQWLGRYRLSLDACGEDWLFRHGDETGVRIADSGRALECHCPDPAHLPLLAEIITRRVLPRVSALHGRLPIHAATLGDGKGATLLLGSSGAGKSTMTAALALEYGWDIFSDDMSVLSADRMRTVWATMPGVSLWRESRHGLNLPAEDCEPLCGYEDKIWYAPKRDKRIPPQPLGVIILLSSCAPGNGIEWKQPSGSALLVMAARQLVVFNPGDADQIRAQMVRLNAMLAGVPAYALAYPRDYNALPHVLDTIRSIRADALSQPV